MCGHVVCEEVVCVSKLCVRGSGEAAGPAGAGAVERGTWSLVFSIATLCSKVFAYGFLNFVKP